MFAIAAAIMFLIAAIKIDATHSPWFWGFLGLMLWALHCAFDIAVPVLSNRRRPVQ